MASNAGARSYADYDAIVIGAGVTGIHIAYLLREMGFSVRVLERGNGVGGTWFWNRYPGARLDSEAYSYGYSFSPEIVQEWDWSERFAGQPELERYANFVVDKLSLRPNIQLNSTVTAADYDERHHVWRLQVDGSAPVSTWLLITALGPLSEPTFPRVPGRERFQGVSFHTARSPRDIDLAGKRVGVIGTGSSGVQVIQEAAKSAAEVHVFQRRPNWCVPLKNAVLSEQEMEEIRAGFDDIITLCAETARGYIHDVDPRSVFDVSPEEREQFWESRYQTGGMALWQGNFRDVLTDPSANQLLSDFVASKIRARVADPATAELLVPKDHGFGTRRVPLETNYYEAFNQPNVHLVDLNTAPLTEITAAGVRTEGGEYPLDVIVYATGFDAITGAFDRIAITGTGGITLGERWAPEPATVLGVMTDGFPNLFMAMGPHAAFGNFPRSLEFNGIWIRDLIRHAVQTGSQEVAASAAAVREWQDLIRRKGDALLASSVDSWITGVNANVVGREHRRHVTYAGSGPEYRAQCDTIARDGYPGFDLH